MTKILITGATGTLGGAFSRVCHTRGLAHHCTTRQELDIADPASIASAMERLRPWAVINTAGYVRVDAAESDRATCMRENAEGPALLAAACARVGAQFVTFSSDLVFDGTKGSSYLEGDLVHPLNVYGASKVAAELRVCAVLPEALIIRTSAFFGPWDRYNFIAAALSEVGEGRRFAAAGDLTITPTYVPDLVHATLDLLIDGAGGIWHLANQGSVTWAGFARMACQMAGMDDGAIDVCPMVGFGWKANRPRAVPLGSSRGLLLPPLDDALRRFLTERVPVAPYGNS